MRLVCQHNKKPFHHYHCAIDDDPKVNGAHRKKIGGHTFYLQADESKQQRERNDNGNNQRSSPVEHKEKDHQCYQENPFNKIVQDRVSAKIHQIVPVIEGHHLHVRRKDLCVQLFYFILNPCQHFPWVFSLAHYHDAFHHIIVIVKSCLAYTRYMTFTHVRNIFYKDGRSIDIVNNNVP